ncbi:helix-turn-helix domain-containing protein [Desulfosporosinus sp.]|uniref:helix-turn-helix domain-containing protein n=1 Tax=Desulfosporosinus sp. TaxID=157907 RepID=UPI00260DA998|nr:helix-turn-helix domain-containing protein [Desulfosporosinus sp.]
MVLDNFPDILTVKELSKLLKISDQAIKRAITSGKLEALKAGGVWRIEKEAVIKWVKQ